MKKYNTWGYDSFREGDHTDVEIIWDINEGGYSWGGVALLRRTTEDEHVEYGVYVDGGCSCSYMYENSPESSNIYWTDNLRNAHGAAVKAIRELSNYDFGFDRKIDLISSLKVAVHQMENEL